jgi:threonine/homoserine/homoserine lactone efflux protein
VNAAAGLFFAAALATAVAMPGPSTAAVVARVLAHGPHGAARLCLGLLAGDLFWLLCALSGAAALAAGSQALFDLLRYGGAAYLLHGAAKLWWSAAAAATREDDEAHDDSDRGRLLLSGLAIALGNPKTVLFYLALLPAIVRVDALSAHDVSLLVALTATVVTAVLFAYALLAERLRQHFRSPAALRRINRAGALLMAGAAVAIVLR